MTIPRPNLFIIGAPKCGTTSMFDFLVQHPEFSCGIHKEPHFFNDDHDEYRHARDLTQYLGFFSGGEASRYLIDASTHYIYSRNAVSNVLDFNPMAKLIVMLRKPVDLVVSLHTHLRFKQSEPIAELRQAWNSGPLRERAPEFVKKHPFPGHISYKEVGMLAKYYQPVKDLVPPHQLLTVFFDDIVSRPREIISQVGEFLGVRFDSAVEFSKSNQKQQVLSSRLNRLVFYPPPWLKMIKAGLKSVLPKRIRQNLDIRTIISRKQPSKSSVDDALRLEITDFFSADIRRLGIATGRDLQSWL